MSSLSYLWDSLLSMPIFTYFCFLDVFLKPPSVDWVKSFEVYIYKYWKQVKIWSFRAESLRSNDKHLEELVKLAGQFHMKTIVLKMNLAKRTCLEWKDSLGNLVPQFFVPWYTNNLYIEDCDQSVFVLIVSSTSRPWQYYWPGGWLSFSHLLTGRMNWGLNESPLFISESIKGGKKPVNENSHVGRNQDFEGLATLESGGFGIQNITCFRNSFIYSRMSMASCPNEVT